MKLTGVLISAAIFASASANRQGGLIYTFDTSRPLSTSHYDSSSAETVSLETAQLILDRRLGTGLKEEIGSVAGQDDRVLEILNTFGGVQKALLSSTSLAVEKTRKVLIALEGFEFTGKGNALHVSDGHFFQCGCEAD